MVQHKPGSSLNRRVTPFLLLLTCAASFSFLGCPQHPKLGGRRASYPCGHQDVQLNDQTGVDKKFVFVCELGSLSTRTARPRLRCRRALWGCVSNTQSRWIMTRTNPSILKSSSWGGVRSGSQISQRCDDAGGVFRVLE